MKKILKYEAKQLFRDKKTIFFVFILPLVIFPVINGLLSKVITSKIETISEEKAQVVSQKDTFLTDIFEKFRNDSIFTIVYADDVKNTDSLLSIYPAIITNRYDDSLKLNSIVVTYSAKKDKQSIQADNFIRRLKDIRDSVKVERYKEIGVEDYFRESEPGINNLASIREMVNSQNANLLPITIIIILMLGTFMISNYIILGEKDNNTLESLLSSGVRREHIIYGKMSMVISAGIIMSLLELISFFLYGKFTGIMSFDISLNQVQVYSFILIVVTASILISSVSVFISCKLKTSVSGQLVFLPLMITYLVLTLFGTFEGIEIKRGLLLLPVINSSGMIKAVIKDQFILYDVFIVAFSNLLYSFFIVKSSSDYLNGEDILNKDTDIDVKRTGFSKAAIFTIYALLVVSYMVIGGYFQSKDIVSGLIYSQVLILGGFVLIMSRSSGIKLQILLKLKKVHIKYLVIAVILGLTARYPISLISDRLLDIFPMPKIINEMDILKTDLGQINIFFMLFIIGVLPAVFEEAAFRGVFLSLSEKKYSAVKAAVITGLMFGGIHLNVFTMFETAFLGIILALLTVYSGSVFPAMIMHFINNGMSVILMKSMNDGILDENHWIATSEYFAYIMSITAIASFGYVVYNGKKVSVS